MLIRCVLLVLLFGSSGCEQRPAAEQLLDDYLTRLARVLDLPKSEVLRQTLPRMPAASSLQQNIPAIKIDLLDYWAFRKCGLTLLLSERNSVLGRVMTASQHLHMDGRILQQLVICNEQIKDTELQQLTQELLILKRAHWPARYWNATIAGPELRSFWSTATEPLIPGHEATYTPADAALRELVKLPQKLQNKTWPDIRALESHYQQLDAYALGGKLLQSLQLSRDYLASANQMLLIATEEKTLCPRGTPRKELDYARNVMQKYFIGEVQPWLASVNQRSILLLPSYQQLVAQQDVKLLPLITTFHQQVTDLYEDFLKQTRAHVAHWQTLFDACGASAIKK